MILFVVLSTVFFGCKYEPVREKIEPAVAEKIEVQGSQTVENKQSETKAIVLGDKKVLASELLEDSVRMSLLLQDGGSYIVRLEKLIGHSAKGSAEFRIIDTLVIRANEKVLGIVKCEDVSGGAVYTVRSAGQGEILGAWTCEHDYGELLVLNSLEDIECQEDGPTDIEDEY